MKTTLKTLISSALASLVLLATHSSYAASWHTGHIRTIYPLGNGNFIVTFMEPVPTCDDELEHPYLYAIVGANGVTVEGINKIYSAFMAAAAMGKRVSVNFDETNPSCTINRASIRIGID